MIPVSRAVVIKDDNEEYYVDGQLLIRDMIVSNNYTNPVTGTPLSDDAVKQLRDFRLRCMKVVVVSDMRIKEFSNVFSFTIDGHQEIIDLYTTCIRLSSIPTGALSNTIVEVETHRVIDSDLGLKVSEYCTPNRIVNVTLSNGNVDAKTIDIVAKSMYAYTEKSSRVVDAPTFSFHAPQCPGRVLG